VDGAAIGSEKILRRLTGKVAGVPDLLAASDVSDLSEETASPEQRSGKAGVKMRFGQWVDLRVLRDLRIRVAG
jgi:hypothetical protein